MLLAIASICLCARKIGNAVNRSFLREENIANEISYKCTSESRLTYHAAVVIPDFVLGNIETGVFGEAGRRRRGYTVDRVLQRGSKGVFVIFVPVFRGFDKVASHRCFHVTGLKIATKIRNVLHYDYRILSSICLSEFAFPKFRKVLAKLRILFSLVGLGLQVLLIERQIDSKSTTSDLQLRERFARYLSVRK